MCKALAHIALLILLERVPFSLDEHHHSMTVPVQYARHVLQYMHTAVCILIVSRLFLGEGGRFFFRPFAFSEKTQTRNKDIAWPSCMA